jgi:DNA-binding transcriptional MerR regulator
MAGSAINHIHKNGAERMSDLIKMKDLVARSGVSRDTIHFYISEGLLPPPVRKSRNMAWYDTSHVEGLAVIKRLQEERFLPLKAIKASVGPGDDRPFTADQEVVLKTLRKEYAARASSTPGVADDANNVCARLQMTASDLALLAERDVIALERNGDRVMISAEDVTILEGLARIREVVKHPDGTWRPEDWDMLNKLAIQLLQEEVAVFATRFADLDPNNIWDTVHEVVPIINEVFGILHMKHIRLFVESVTAGTDDTE